MTEKVLTDLRKIKNTARLDFAAVSADLFREFPALGKNTLIYDVAAGKLYGKGKLFERAASNEMKIAIDGKLDGRIVGMMDYLKEEFKDEQHSTVIPFGNFNIIAYALDAGRANLTAFGREKEIADRFLTDHEIGHIVAKGMGFKRVEGTEIETPETEMKADAYAILRSLQRYGYRGFRNIDRLAFGRALQAIDYGIVSHLTTLAADGLRQAAIDTDFLKLTPKQTAAAAKRFAEKMLPRDADLKALVAAFAPLQGKMAGITAENTKPLWQLAGIITQKGANPYAVYLGARVLKEFLKDGGCDFNSDEFQGRIALAGTEWDGMKKKIGQALDAIPARHALGPLKASINGSRLKRKEVRDVFPLKK